MITQLKRHEVQILLKADHTQKDTARLEGYAGGKSALFALAAILRPEQVRVTMRFEGQNKMVDFLDSQGVQFSISVPFEPFAELKLLIESRRRWKRLDSQWGTTSRATGHPSFGSIATYFCFCAME